MSMPDSHRASGFFASLGMTGTGCRRIFLCFLCSLWPAVTACSRHQPAASEKLLRVSQRNEPATLDPQFALLPDEFFIIRALDEGLVTPTPDGGGEPAVAERWETSADGLTWTFHLRADARWSHGEPVTAADFVYTVRRALTPALAAPKAPLFFALKNAEAFYRGRIPDFTQVGVAAPDVRTLVLTLEHPTPHLLALVASGPWLPVHAATVEKFGNTRGSAWTRPGNFTGNGPFTLAEWRPHEFIRVQKNSRYRTADRVQLDGIRFQVYDNGDTEERAFRAGQVDVTMAVPFSKLGSYARPPLHTLPLAETRYLAFNLRRPPLDDARVRRALTLAVDRSALVTEVLKGGEQPALSFIPPGLGGYQPATRLTADLGLARRLLAEAGFPAGKDFPTLEVSTWSASSLPALEALQQMWRHKLGIETTLVRREANVHVAALRAGDYAIGFLPAIPDYNDAAALFGDLTTGAANNYPRWSHARYDALVAKAGRTTDVAHRLALYHDAEALLLDELPVAPLYFNTQNFLLRPGVHGWQQDSLWTRRYSGISLGE
jgi:oligopeptide transport system substrate-binding protein